MKSAKVVIIGTGPSGLAAATKLLELGFDQVSLVEAEDRFGGRINTIPFGDNVVDLGAQWCHGEKGNIVFEMAFPLNLLERSEDQFDQFDSIRSNKQKVPKNVNRIFKNIMDEIEEAQKKELVNYEGSYGSYVTKKFFDALKRPENSEVDMETAKEFFEAYKKMECSSSACDTLDDASGKGMVEYWDCEGDGNLSWKDKGYRTFLRLLLKCEETGNELGVLNDRIQFEKKVKEIVWGDGGQVKLKCEDNDEIVADHIITTVSLGVLKATHKTLFVPSLPAEKIRAIEGLGFGTINKIILEFPTSFWPEDWRGFIMLWSEEDLKEIRGTKKAWLEDLFVFDAPLHKPRVLFGWMVGPNGRLMEKLPEEEVLEGCMYLLRRFLPWNIPTPLKMKRSTWSSNDNFRGSYSFRSMLTEELKTGATDLSKPLTDSANKPVVLFAGEATSEHHFSTVHGAVETGRREAERLAKFYESKA